jgi:hypothetical protein
LVKMTNENEHVRRQAEGSINAFLNGKKNQKWAIAMIETSKINKEGLKKLFSDFNNRAPNNPQLLELEKACGEKGYL